ncbi:metal ABC transporter substrate-binding protein [Demequina sp. B12]|uniref:metal ABC transporter substrate-binding protein n=1 Tax=Demequina sp. B12 TaxID=2992757 RepID=UPI00237C45C2|nr:metal ABC transporter substrate-binding protein [Demequina sp. B12]MDE0571998.1 metal ABC transporter substrate-binding protein [Demequina sp. B12]
MPNFPRVRGDKVRVLAVASALSAVLLTACAAGTGTGTGAADSADASASGQATTVAPADNADAPLVLTTFTVLADMAGNVAGDDLRVESITKIGSEIHGYEPTPGDIRGAQDADLILDNGLGLEAWFAKFVESVDAPHVVVSADVDPIDIAGDAYAGKPNPHAWMSPTDAQLYVDQMVDAFSTLDPDNAADYERRGEDYKTQIADVAAGLDAALAGIPESQRALVTCEGAFSYLTRDAGLDEVYLWPVNAEQQATPQQIAAAIEYVNDNDVPAVFCESTVSDKAMRQVVDATDAEFGGTLYVDSLSDDTGPVPTYLDLLRHDVELIVEGLAGGVAASDAGETS